MIPQGCDQGTDPILVSRVAEDTAPREGGEPAAEDDNEAGKDGDTSAKLSHLTCYDLLCPLTRYAEQAWCQPGVQRTMQACSGEAPAPPRHSLARTTDKWPG